MVPKLSRVAFLFDPANSSNAVELEQLRGSASGLGVTLRTMGVRGLDDIEKAFGTMIRERENATTRREEKYEIRRRIELYGHVVSNHSMKSYGCPNLVRIFCGKN
jgi:hypothetical protein